MGHAAEERFCRALRMGSDAPRRFPRPPKVRSSSEFIGMGAPLRRNCHADVPFSPAASSSHVLRSPMVDRVLSFIARSKYPDFYIAAVAIAVAHIATDLMRAAFG